MAGRLVLFTHKGIHYESQTSGEVTAIMVPTREQIQIFGDVDSPNNQELSQRYGMEGKKLLWRVEDGKVTVYGTLDEELQKERKRVRVYLPQDFVSPETTVLFFVMDEKWIVHGVKEIDDEKRSEWKLTAYNTKGTTPAKLILEILTEVMLSGNNEKTVVAVHDNPSVLAELKKSLKSLDIDPVPLASLHPGPQKPLYQHGDYGVLLMALVMFGGLMLLGSTFYWVANIHKAKQIQEEIEQVRDQVAHVQINEHLGYIHEPQPILNTMQKALKQQPSAVIDGVAQFAKQFGELSGVEFQLATEGGEPILSQGSQKVGNGEMQVRAHLKKVKDILLLNQEAEALQILPLHPWIRSVTATGMSNADAGGDLSIVLQTEKPAIVDKGGPLEEETPTALPLPDAVLATSPTVFPATSSPTLPKLPAPPSETKPMPTAVTSSTGVGLGNVSASMEVSR